MAGDPNNVLIWGNADVYVLFPEDIPVGQTILDMVPANIDAAWPVAWGTAGLLDGDAGFEESAEWDKTEHKAWGYGVIKVGYKDFTMTRKFTALERNPVTKRLKSKNDTTNRRKVSKPADVYLGFEKLSDNGIKERLITTMPASCMFSGNTENEADLPSAEFENQIFPNSLKELFITQETGVVAQYGPYILTLSAGLTAGTFKAQVGEEETTPLGFNPTASAIDAALEALSTVDSATVSGATGGPFTITYVGTGTLSKGDNSLVGGATPNFTIA